MFFRAHHLTLFQPRHLQVGCATYAYKTMPKEVQQPGSQWMELITAMTR